jgi:uncharacterized protein YkwD
MLRNPPRRILTALLVSTGLLLGNAVVASSAGATTPSAAVANVYADKVLGLMNIERAAHGLPLLRMNAQLESAAHRHNLRMAAYNTMSHLLPGESTLGVRVSAAGYNWRNIGENVAYTSNWCLAGAYSLQQLMYNERSPNDAHRRVILNPVYRDVGVDIYMDGAHHKMWLTEDFGRHM